MKDIINVVLWLWQLPQNLLAALVVFIYKARKVYSGYDNVSLFEIPSGTKWMAVSLGNSIIYNQTYNSAPQLKAMILDHEYGHYKQSLIFGPLYLLIIGIPSLLNVLYVVSNPSKAEEYYKRWPENWADTLGNVNRNKITVNKKNVSGKKITTKKTTRKSKAK